MYNFMKTIFVNEKRKSPQTVLTTFITKIVDVLGIFATSRLVTHF